MIALPDWASVAGLLARARSTYRAMVHRADVEMEMREEFQHHLAERVDHLHQRTRAGLDAALEYPADAAEALGAVGADGLAPALELLDELRVDGEALGRHGRRCVGRSSGEGRSHCRNRATGAARGVHLLLRAQLRRRPEPDIGSHEGNQGARHRCGEGIARRSEALIELLLRH